MLNRVKQQVKELDQFRAMQGEIDPTVQQQEAAFNQIQHELKEMTRQRIQELGYQKDCLQNRHFATNCTDEISLLTQIAKMEF